MHAHLRNKMISRLPCSLIRISELVARIQLYHLEFLYKLINIELIKSKMFNANPLSVMLQFYHLTYHERLSILDLESLELRRQRFDLVQHHKINNQ
jgi:hypothetical protein